MANFVNFSISSTWAVASLLPINKKKMKLYINTFSFSPVNTLESDESDEDFVRPNRRPATSKAQWEMWHKTTEQIYQLIQQQLNMPKNLR